MIPAELYSRPAATWLATPIYFGRRDFLVDTGDYYVPPWHPGVAVVLSESGPNAFANVCRHRQSIILSGRGTVSKIRCSMHGWSWDLNGKSTASPGFESGSDLLAFDMVETGGWMYAPGSTFSNAIDDNPYMELSGYELLESNTYEFACSWLDYVDVSVDLNHVPYVHPGLHAWTDCSNPEVVYGDGWSVQTVPFKDGGNVRGVAKVWWETLVDRFPDIGRKHARWTHIYPNIMIENYAGLFVGIAVIQPNGTDCIIHEDVWVRHDTAGDAELGKAFSGMYAELEDEDKILMMAQQSGRNALMSMGLKDSGPYQDPTEMGMEHFHQWLIDREADAIPSARQTTKVAR